MKRNNFISAILVCSYFLISNNIQAATVIGFENVISGDSSYSFDSNGDSISDITFSTTSPNGLLAVSDYPSEYFFHHEFIGGAVLGVSNGPLRIDFVNGISNSFGFAFSGSVSQVKIFDNNDNELPLNLLISPYNYGRLDFEFPLTASYALIEGGNFAIDEFDGTYSSNDLPELQGHPLIPVPAAIWLFGSALLGVFGKRKIKKLKDIY